MMPNQLLSKIRSIAKIYHYTKSEIDNMRNNFDDELSTHTHNYISEDTAVQMLMDYGLIRSTNTINSILLTTDKTGLSYKNNENAVFSATVYNDDGDVITGKTITFYINNEVYDTAITDNTGVATVSYVSRNAGDLTVKAVADNVSSANVYVTDVYENIFLTELYNKDWRYFHISTHWSTTTISQLNDGEEDGVQVSRTGCSGSTGIKLHEFTAGTAFTIQKEFYSYNGVWEGFILATDDATYSLAVRPNEGVFGGKREVSNWDSDSWGNDTSIYEIDNIISRGVMESNKWFILQMVYDGENELSLNYYDTDYNLINTGSITIDLNKDFTLYSLNCYCGTNDSGCSNKNWNKNVKLMIL